MRQKQPKTVRLKHHGSGEGGRKPNFTSDLQWERRLGYYRPEFRSHLGNVG